MKYLNLLIEKCAVICVLAVFTMSTSIGANGQCSLSCNGTTQVSLSSSCDATITPNMILSDNGTSCMGGSLSVVVSDDYGTIAGGNIVTSQYAGQTLTAMVIDAVSGNSCWGYIIIEDKLGPTITDCPMGFITLDCPDMNSYPGPVFTDNCDGPLTPVLLSENITTPCIPGIVKRISRTYSAQDSDGNISANTCTVSIQLRSLLQHRIRYPDSLKVSCTQVSAWDSNSNGHIDEGEIPTGEIGAPYYLAFNTATPNVFDTVSLYPYPDIYCNAVVTFEDVILPKIACTQKIMRRWQVNIWHCTDETTYNYTQLIEITDDEGPAIACQEVLELTTNTLISAPGGTYGDFNCGAQVNLPLPTGSDNCSDNLNYDITFPSGHINDYSGDKVTLPMGTNVVLFTVYDDCYNSSTCHVAVNIVDNTPPIAICDQNTTVSLTSGGTATVRPESFDDGSYDDCKMHCSLVRRMDNGSCECRLPEYCDLDYLGNFNGSNYYLSDYSIGAAIAKNRAASYGGGLVIFNSADEEAWCLGVVRNKYAGGFWIGMKSFAGSYLWDDHSAVTYNNFPGGTFPTSGDCVLVDVNNEWQASNCLSSKTAPNDYRYILEVPEGCGFTNGAKFCCEDAGKDHMVVLRVTDFYGNFNDCMVNITVQDKSAPSLTCPANLTVKCDHVYDRNDLDTAFGSLSIGESCGSNILVDVNEQFNECGSGTITRLWNAYATPEPTSQIVAHCKQIITFENDEPFNGDDIECPEQDIVIAGCDNPANFGPEVTGTPLYTGGPCDLLGADYDDRLFTFNNSTGDACFKILRNWEIIDWCQIDPATGSYYTWNCHQVIKVSNTGRPVISGDKPINVCSYDASCTEADVELEVFGEDDCTTAENLNWSYSVFVGSLTSGPTDLSNPAVQVSGTGDHIVASGKYPLGSHIIRWTFYDGCGNATTSDQPFTVTNCKAATAYCINGLAVELMPIDENNDGSIDFGMIELWASDFDAGSYHPCGYPVHLSFSADVTDTNKTFDCLTRGNQVVEIWATVTTPTGDQVQTYCSTFVDIQDNMNACQGQRQVRVDGSISTEESKTIENVSVTLEGSPMQAMTDNTGDYAFPNMAEGGDYVINPYNNDNALNGVSTLDLITIQRHILGLETLDSPYKYIAADIDNNKVINGVDLVELRKLILGLYTEFPKNDSWRFVDKGYAFNNTADPLQDNFTEDYQINNLASDMNVDFVAVKVGDVNNSVDTESSTGRNSKASTSNVQLHVDRISGSNGDIVTIPVAIKGTNVAGFQLELDVTPGLEVIEIAGSSALLNKSSYTVNGNKVAISYSDDKNVSGQLFEIVALVKDANQLDNVVAIRGDRLISEVYNEKGVIFNPVITSPGTNESLIISQNNPNPFSESTQVTIALQESSVVNINVTDVQGKVVSSSTTRMDEGEHIIKISSKDLGSTGIYYLTVQTNNDNKTIKMVLID